MQYQYAPLTGVYKPDMKEFFSENSSDLVAGPIPKWQCSSQIKTEHGYIHSKMYIYNIYNIYNIDNIYNNYK